VAAYLRQGTHQLRIFTYFVRPLDRHVPAWLCPPMPLAARARCRPSALDFFPGIAPGANRHLALAREPYSSLVAGIYSTKPGMLGSTSRVDETPAKDEVPLAVVGIVPCKVSAENGPIHVGDLLITSSPGAIQVLVTLQ